MFLLVNVFFILCEVVSFKLVILLLLDVFILIIIMVKVKIGISIICLMVKMYSEKCFWL